MIVKSFGESNKSNKKKKSTKDLKIFIMYLFDLRRTFELNTYTQKLSFALPWDVKRTI